MQVTNLKLFPRVDLPPQHDISCAIYIPTIRLADRNYLKFCECSENSILYQNLNPSWEAW